MQASDIRAAVMKSLSLAQKMGMQVAESTMNSTVEIRRPAADFFDDTTRLYTPRAAELIYSGMAGVPPATGSVEMDLGDEPTYYSSTTIKIPQNSPHIRIDDVLQVITTPDDGMVNRFFRITDVPVGGRIVASIALSCVGISPSRNWGTS
jgi:hypothetical protein